MEPTLVGGEWNSDHEQLGYRSVVAETQEPLAEYPRSEWPEIDRALSEAAAASDILYHTDPAQIGAFLRRLADRIEARSDEVVDIAATETALPVAPRLAEVELPRTTDQLRQAAEAAESRSWVHPTISTESRIASMFAPIPGALFVLGPNNFPLAFNGVSGGDFAAAIATRHPVLAKANPGHPGTTRVLAEEARAACDEVGVPAATVQMLYDMSSDDGLRLVADSRLAATAYTGSRTSGLGLKAAADTAGVLMYAEMSSVNPVVVLPGAAAERGPEIARELADSLLLGSGQFCTSPGVIFVVGDGPGMRLVEELGNQVSSRKNGPLLGRRVQSGLEETRSAWEKAGAAVIADGTGPTTACSFPNTLMRVPAGTFVSRKELQAEAFGNMGLVIVAGDVGEILECIEALEGNLTGTVYSATDGSDDDAYTSVEPHLRKKVGRLLNDKPPTGVAVVPAMNHGGPFPATTHPGFTAVGIPASLTRFAALHAYDAVPDRRLPPELQTANPLGIQRWVDGTWTSKPHR